MDFRICKKRCLDDYFGYNAGSSSLKYLLANMDTETTLAKGVVECIGMKNGKIKFVVNEKKHEMILEKIDHVQAVSYILDIIVDKDIGVITELEQIKAAGHRVVHGGENLRVPHILDNDVMEILEENVDLAPLHNPVNIVCINACKNLLPSVKMVGVFDTAFHSTIPKKGYLYAIPREAYTKYKVRRYGFHGISHNYVAERAAEINNKDINKLKIITCYLGNGFSVTAIKNGKAIDTSMGLLH